MEAMKMTNVLSKIENRQDQFDQTGVYDWATRELFPAFKGDLRPLAQRVDLWRAWIEGLPIPGTHCRSTQQPYLFRWTLALPARGLSAFLSTFPFQNRNNEETRTIGHLDPPRPGTNFFANYNISGAPFGTTHSLFPAQFGQREQHNAYAAVPNASMTCEPANNWLQRARFANPRENGNRWNAAVLGKAFDSSAVEGAPAARFVHSFPLGGTAATTRANDPILFGTCVSPTA